MDITKFFQLKPREEIERVVRASLLALGPKFLLLGLLFVVPFFFLFPLFKQGTFGIVLFIVLVSFAALIIWREYFKWIRTVLIITTKRVVDVEQRGFFYKVVSESQHLQIDEVTYAKKGFLETVFRFGTIKLHMRGEGADIEFERVPRPELVYDLINDLRLEHAKK